MENQNYKKRSNTVQPVQPSNISLSTTPKKFKPQTFGTGMKIHQPKVNTFYPSQTAKLDRFVGNFSTRASGKITCISPTTELKSTKTQVETMESIVKEHLKKLNYREKLSNIEVLLKNCQELCQQFGYFYITCAMLFYDPFNQVKLSVWVHPDTRATKCLHPIVKNTQEESEIQFISNLKLIIKQFFPTIYLGNGRNFATLIGHITDLKSQLFSKNKNSRPQLCSTFSTLPEKSEKISFNSKFNDSYSFFGKKTFTKMPRVITEEADLDEPQKRKKVNKTFESRFKKGTRQNSYIAETQPQIKKVKPEQKVETQKTFLGPPTPTQFSLNEFNKSLKNPASSFCKSEKDQDETKKHQKNSEIEEQLNNLFGSHDFSEDFYDKDRISQATNKKSMMQRMADEFDQLF